LNRNGIAKGLSPSERFRLVLAATDRGDQAEADRLAAAGERITLSFPEHAPYLQGFVELATVAFLELAELASSYDRAFVAWASTDPPRDDDDEDLGEGEQEPTNDPRGTDTCEVDQEAARDEDVSCEYADRLGQTALAFGYLLKTRAEGWRLFCERLTISPLFVWARLPGFDRVQGALALAENAAFVPEGMSCWMNRHRPAGAPEVTAATVMTPEKIAAELAEQFDKLVAHWSGV
jgi:hypothetical protein